VNTSININAGVYIKNLFEKLNFKLILAPFNTNFHYNKVVLIYNINFVGVIIPPLEISILIILFILIFSDFFHLYNINANHI